VFKLLDRTKFNTSTTGTGDITIGSVSSSAFYLPSEAGAADGDTVRYIVQDGNDIEEGIGTIADSVATLQRTTVTASKVGGSAGTSKLNLSGTAVVSLTASGADILVPSNNLSDVTDAATALANLGGVSSATTISGSGLVSGGGDLSADRTVTVTAASKSDQQTGTSSTVAVTPAHQQDHASAAKAWCLDNGAATPVASASYNISSLTDNGVGDTTFNFTTAMASANYSAVASMQSGLSFSTQAATRVVDTISKSTSAVRFATGFWSSTVSGAGSDMPISMTAFGEQ
jgi:hypothetical protein